MTKQCPGDGLPAFLTWPPLPEAAVLTAKRVDVACRQQMWFIDQSESGFTLAYASRTPSGTWSSFAIGTPKPDLIAAAQADDQLVSLRADEITVYRIVDGIEFFYTVIHALLEALTCIGLESPQPGDWPPEIGSFWATSDSDVEAAYNGFECTSRWAFIDKFRVSCIRFEDVTPPDLIPALFDEWQDLATLGAVGEASFSEDDDMGRPFSLSGQMTLIRFRPGYAISLHESNADWVAGPTYLMRLPLDPAEEAATISAWQDEMDEATFANYEEDEAEEVEGESNDVVPPPTANHDRRDFLTIVPTDPRSAHDS